MSAMSEWAESRRHLMTDATIAANVRLNTPPYDVAIESSVPAWGDRFVTSDGVTLEWDTTGMDADAEPSYVEVS